MTTDQGTREQAEQRTTEGEEGSLITVPVYRAGVAVDGFISKRSAAVFQRVFAAYRGLGPRGMEHLQREVDRRRRPRRPRRGLGRLLRFAS